MKFGVGKEFLKEFLIKLKKWPILGDFLDEIHNDDKTFQEVQRDCKCGPLTHHIMLLKFEDFCKNPIFMIFWPKIYPPPGWVLHCDMMCFLNLT